MSEINLILNILIAISSLQAFVIPNGDSSENTIYYDTSMESELEEKWFEQYLDHFNIQDNRTFYVRYFEEDKYFKPGGPLLLEIGGEGAISSDSIANGQSYLLAKELHGKIVLLEHRYYGKSSPFEELTAENLTYLTVEEALEDLAYFVETYKQTTPGLKQSKVAVFGCSYSASLATWFRYKFPHLVDAAWASSAPLRAVSDFFEYLEVAGEVYFNVSSNCYNAIERGYSETKLLLSTPEGEELVKTVLKDWSCGNITEMSADDILGYIRFVLADHNIPPTHGPEICKTLRNYKSNATDFQKLADLVITNSPSMCTNLDDEYPNDGLAWNYQTCTEFGFSVTTTSKNQPFNDSHSNIDDDLETCLNFGEDFTEDLLQRGIDRINRVYGSVNLKATKVLSIHGTQDPWYKLGLHKETNEEAPVILIPGVSHCGDQQTYSKEPSQVTKAKNKARKIMAKWLQ